MATTTQANFRMRRPGSKSRRLVDHHQHMSRNMHNNRVLFDWDNNTSNSVVLDYVETADGWGLPRMRYRSAGPQPLSIRQRLHWGVAAEAGAANGERTEVWVNEVVTMLRALSCYPGDFIYFIYCCRSPRPVMMWPRPAGKTAWPHTTPLITPASDMLHQGKTILRRLLSFHPLPVHILSPTMPKQPSKERVLATKLITEMIKFNTNHSVVFVHFNEFLPRILFQKAWQQHDKTFDIFVFCC